MTGPTPVREFVAVAIPEEIRRCVAAAGDRLVACDAPVRWVRPALYHVTLRFLGEIDPDRTGDAAVALDDAGRGATPGRVRCHGIGSFDRRGLPTVVWAGCEDLDGALADAYGRIDDALAGLGFPRQQRPFRAHVTLGRVHRRGAAPGPAVDRLTSEIDSLRSAEFGMFTAESMVLMRSDLTPRGPVYTPLHEAPLKGETDGSQGRRQR